MCGPCSARNITAIYAGRAGLKYTEVAKMMADESWFDSGEALAWGLADEVGQPLKMAAATVQAGRYRNTPKQLIDSGSRFLKLDAAMRLVEELSTELG